MFYYKGGETDKQGGIGKTMRQRNPRRGSRQMASCVAAPMMTVCERKWRLGQTAVRWGLGQMREVWWERVWELLFPRD